MSALGSNSKGNDMQEISDRPSNAVRDIFGRDKVLIGMIHCPAFPGAPRYRGAAMDAIYDACMRDAEACVEGGLHGLIIENHGDVPFSKPEVMVELAKKQVLSIYYESKQVATLRLTGSFAATQELVACQRAIVASRS